MANGFPLGVPDVGDRIVSSRLFVSMASRSVGCVTPAQGMAKSSGREV